MEHIAGSWGLQNTLQAPQKALYMSVSPGKGLSSTYISELRAQAQA